MPGFRNSVWMLFILAKSNWSGSKRLKVGKVNGPLHVDWTDNFLPDGPSTFTSGGTAVSSPGSFTKIIATQNDRAKWSLWKMTVILMILGSDRVSL